MVGGDRTGLLVCVVVGSAGEPMSIASRAAFSAASTVRPHVAFTLTQPAA